MEPVVKYKYNSLEDFLISNPLSVDGQLDDGWGAWFPVKGREIEATILFADVSSFSKITLELSPTEILIFVNNFFTWITAEGLRGKPAIVDKYIGERLWLYSLKSSVQTIHLLMHCRLPDGWLKEIFWPFVLIWE